MWGAMIDYWKLTGDASYNKVATEALLFQVGPGRDYMPPNVTASLGNDDQGFWGMSAMLAAENKFPDPPPDQPQWLALAQAVFNTQAHPDRHDDNCGGGLRWQIPLSNNGYNYKNSIANGCFFNLGARLARYTDNSTYADWAEKTWDWMVGVGFMTVDYKIYDGGHVEHNCTDINKAQFSYNNGVFLLGAAYMYNYVRCPFCFPILFCDGQLTAREQTNGSDKWRDRVDKLTDATLQTFFPDNIAYEPACEEKMTCTTDMLSFKGYMHRWLSTVTQIAPFTADKILPVLKTSTEAAISTCAGGQNSRACGFKWNKKKFDNSVGAGQQMNVLSAVSSLLIGQTGGPVTNSTGGTSIGDPNAGSQSDHFTGEKPPPTESDRAGAGFLTFFILASAVGTWTWMSFGL